MVTEFSKCSRGSINAYSGLCARWLCDDEPLEAFCGGEAEGSGYGIQGPVSPCPIQPH